VIKLLNKYGEKMSSAGLAENPLLCGLDDELYWNRQDDSIPLLNNVLNGMNINSLICAEPAEPYLSILQYLTRQRTETITPRDCETRTFLHDLPVVYSFAPELILEQLRKRKSVIVNSDDSIRIITFGTVSPEQAFVTFSSVCFSTFVLFFSDFLTDHREGKIEPAQQQTFDAILPLVDKTSQPPPILLSGPFTTESQVVEAMIEAGKQTVAYGLVDSYFGNISYRLNDTVYISQTGSSLDELGDCIDPCPLDGSSCAGITASSELSAHNDILLRTKKQAILHGHPKFTVILSMDCEIADCPQRGQCHIKCSQERSINDIPIVPGEVGTGPTGLCNTLPPAIQGKRGAIVWGHGLFTTGATDFQEAFQHLLDIENMCRKEYFKQLLRQ
jgi:ribulose-5-phosphate 4-epimerase/fuculose-1-phosphate aldolase